MTTDGTDRSLDQAEHRIIQQARSYADQVRTMPLPTIGPVYAALEATEDALTTLIVYTRPIEGVHNFDGHLEVVRIVTREHYYPALQWALSGSWYEVADRWGEALTAVGADSERVRRLGAITHAEAVAACEYLGIGAPEAPVDIDARRREAYGPDASDDLSW